MRSWASVSYLCISAIDFPGPLSPPLHSPSASLAQHFPGSAIPAFCSAAPLMTTNLLPVQLWPPWHSSALSKPGGHSLVMKKAKKTTELFYTQNNANHLSLVLTIPFQDFNISQFDPLSPSSNSIPNLWLSRSCPQSLIIISIMSLHSILFKWLKLFNMKCTAFSPLSHFSSSFRRRGKCFISESISSCVDFQ